jgi:hypothetical protein
MIAAQHVLPLTIVTSPAMPLDTMQQTWFVSKDFGYPLWEAATTGPGSCFQQVGATTSSWRA